MITINDIGKKVFLRYTMSDGAMRWENNGDILKGFTGDGTRVIVQIAENGQIWKFKPEVVRVFEPRPK